MWQQYKKTLVVNQAFIIMACLVSHYMMNMAWFVVLLLFLVMQFGALLGAWFAAGMVRRAQERKTKLPLQK